MWDLLGVIADLLFAVPFGIVLALVGSVVCWTWVGTPGAGFGTIAGLATGLWLDDSNGRHAKVLRLPVGISAAALLLFAFFK